MSGPWEDYQSKPWEDFRAVGLSNPTAEEKAARVSQIAGQIQQRSTQPSLLDKVVGLLPESVWSGLQEGMTEPVRKLIDLPATAINAVAGRPVVAPLPRPDPQFFTGMFSYDPNKLTRENTVDNLGAGADTLGLAPWGPMAGVGGVSRGPQSAEHPVGGAIEGMLNTGVSLLDPDVFAQALPFGAGVARQVPRLAALGKALVAARMAQELPGVNVGAAKTAMSPETTPTQKGTAMGQAAAQDLLAGLVGREVMRPRVPQSLVTGATPEFPVNQTLSSDPSFAGEVQPRVQLDYTPPLQIPARVTPFDRAEIDKTVSQMVAEANAQQRQETVRAAQQPPVVLGGEPQQAIRLPDRSVEPSIVQAFQAAQRERPPLSGQVPPEPPAEPLPPEPKKVKFYSGFDPDWLNKPDKELTPEQQQLRRYLVAYKDKGYETLYSEHGLQGEDEGKTPYVVFKRPDEAKLASLREAAKQVGAKVEEREKRVGVYFQGGTPKEVLQDWQDFGDKLTQPSDIEAYHGTATQFPETEFKPLSHFGAEEKARGRRESQAEVTPESGWRVSKYRLDIKKPLRVPDFGEQGDNFDPDVIAGYLRKQGTFSEADWKEAMQDDTGDSLVKVLSRKGYDGLVYKNTGEVGPPSDSYVIFRSDQVKLGDRLTQQKGPQYDTQNKGRVQGGVPQGQEPRGTVQEQGSSAKAVEGSRILQTPEGGVGGSGRLYSGVSPLAENLANRERELRGETFAMSAPRMIVTPAESGFAKPEQEYDATQVWNRIANKAPKAEVEMMREAGVDEAIKSKGKISPTEAAKLMQESGPRVEVRKMGEKAKPVGEIAVKRERMLQLQHEVYDSLNVANRLGVDKVIEGTAPIETMIEAGRRGGLSEPYLKDLEEFINLKKELGQTTLGDVTAEQLSFGEGTHWEKVSPTDKMDRYVEIAVTKPLKGDKLYQKKVGQVRQVSRQLAQETGTQFPSTHSFPPNTLGWVRGYMETLPDGKKVFRVIEVQSDWGQKVREQKAELDKRLRADNPDIEMANAVQQGIQKFDDPLLKHYERLTLKAAIDHAKREGADAIAIDDAETAMMTEGHDRSVMGESREALMEMPDGSRVRYTGIPAVEEGLRKGGKIIEDSGIIPPRRPHQEGGMRLHYDQTLPRIAEELTGQKGEKVEFGEHKMAMQSQTEGGEYLPRDPEATYIPRKDLIFRNPDGTPKTTSTARVYDISKAGGPGPKATSPFSLFEKDKPETRPEYLYAGVPITAITKPLKAAWDKLGELASRSVLAGDMAQTLDAADAAARIGGRQKARALEYAMPNKLDRQAVTAMTFPGLVTDPKVSKYAAANSTRLSRQRQAFDQALATQRAVEKANGVNSAPLDAAMQRIVEDKGAIDAGQLLQARVSSGLLRINRERMLQQLKTASGDPLVRSTKGQKAAPTGYTRMTLPTGERMDVADEFVKPLRSLLGESWVRENPVGNALLETESAIKHGLLAFDSYHMFRMMRKELFLTGKVSWNKGVSLLENDAATINAMEKAGDIKPEMADWVRANRGDANLLIGKGLNVAQMSQLMTGHVLNILRSEVKVGGVDVNVLGRSNKWIFDKLSRGAMLESALIELKRTMDARPELTKDQAASLVARKMNTYYGSLGRQGTLKTATARDLGNLAFLAPQWVDSMVRTEAGAALDIGKAGVDLAQGKPRIGSLGKGVGTGVLAYFVANQIINQLSRGKYTWDNPEKEHKMDAYVPSMFGEGGFWLSPFSDVAEITHDYIRYSNKGMSPIESTARIAQNKLSPLGRAEEALRVGTDYTGVPLEGGERVKATAKALAPTPLPLAGAFSETPHQGERQLYSSAGLKVEPESRSERIARETAGKTFVERREAAKVEKENQPDMTEHQRQAALLAHDKRMRQHREEVRAALPQEDQTWLRSNRIDIPGFGDFSMSQKVQIRWTDTEVKKFQQMARDQYEEVVAFLRNDPGFKAATDNERKVMANKQFGHAAERVRRQFTSQMRRGE